MKLNFSNAALVALAFFAAAESRGDEINHAKFIAERAAFSALEGPNAFTLRESWLKGNLSPGEAKLVPQQLFRKNTYQFWFAVPDQDAGVLLNIYDGKGRLMEADTVKVPGKENVKSIIVTPEKTGTYYLRLSLTKRTGKAQDWALIYAYR